VTKQQSLTARSSLLPYDYDLLSGYPNIFPIAGLCNFILPEYLDLSNQQMVNSDLLRSDARSHCSSDLYPCMERISTDLVDYSLRYYSTRALNFRDLRLSDFERSGLQLVQFTADCLLSISTRSPIVDIFWTTLWKCPSPGIGYIHNLAVLLTRLTGIIQKDLHAALLASLYVISKMRTAKSPRFEIL
jgi:hypothetical protein